MSRRFIQLKSGLSRFSGFALTALLSGAINVATIPLVVGAVGSQAWAAIATGQAVGLIGSIFIQLGWGVTGPAEIAAARTEAERTKIFVESLLYRAATLPIALVLVAFVSWRVVPSESATAACIAGIGSALLGLTASWYFVGKGDATGLLRLDTLPRIGVTAVGAAALLLYPSPILFAFAIVVSSILPILCASFSILRRIRISQPKLVIVFGWKRVQQLASVQLPGVVTSVISQSYRYLPLVAISVLRPEHVAAYALIDRIVKFAVAAIKPLSQSLQVWVPAAGEGRLLGRIWKAMALAGVGGGVSAIVFIVLSPLATKILGTDAIQTSHWYYIPAALAVGITVVTQTGLLALLALRRIGAVAWAATAGGIVGTALLWPAVTHFGTLGGLYCLTAAELTVMIFQLFALLRAARTFTPTLVENERLPSG